MKFNKQGEQEVSFTCIVSVPASPLHHALMVSETPMTEFAGFPTSGFKSIKRKENNFNPKTVSTQFIYHRLGEPDDKSFAHQIGVLKTIKTSSGKLIKKYPEHTTEEFIMAQVLSKVHDSISGKMEGVSFTYASNDLNFKAKWAYGRNKFVVLTD
mgnify:CR=1 FL=1